MWLTALTNLISRFCCFWKEKNYTLSMLDSTSLNRTTFGAFTLTYVGFIVVTLFRDYCYLS
jgi:hypothetical protein